jgi:hypothetical protein
MSVAQTIKPSGVGIGFANFIHKLIVSTWLHFVNVFVSGKSQGYIFRRLMGKRLAGKPVPIIKNQQKIFDNQHSQKTGLSQLIFHRVEKPNVRRSCLRTAAKISEIKRITKPYHLSIETYTLRQKMPTEEFGKYCSSSLFY